MTDYDITTIKTSPSLMAEFDPIFIGRLEKLRPYIIRGILYLMGGCIYLFIIYLILLTIGGLCSEA